MKTHARRFIQEGLIKADLTLGQSIPASLHPSKRLKRFWWPPLHLPRTLMLSWKWWMAFVLPSLLADVFTSAAIDCASSIVSIKCSDQPIHAKGMGIPSPFTFSGPFQTSRMDTVGYASDVLADLQA